MTLGLMNFELYMSISNKVAADISYNHNFQKKILVNKCGNKYFSMKVIEVYKIK